MSVDVERWCTPAANNYRRKISAAIPALNDYELELHCFGRLPIGHQGKHEFCLNLFRYQWPGFVVLESGDIENTFTKRIVKACCESNFVSLLGCASAGKTFAATAYAYTAWKSKCWCSSVYISTTTLNSLQTKTWAAILDFHSRDAFQIGQRLDYRHTIVHQLDDGDKERDYRDAIACVVIEQGNEGQKALAAVSGRKNQNVTWVCDELPYMNVGVLNARINLIANPSFQFIGIGNKPSEGDPLYMDAEPMGDGYPDGWKSVDPSHARWTTKSGICEYLDGEKSPNLGIPDESKPPFPSLMTRRMLDAIALDSGGTDSLMYWHQARGFPMTGDTMDRVLTWRTIERYGANTDVVWGHQSPVTLCGFDPGFKKDGDPCCAAFAQLGTDESGKKVLMHEPDTMNIQPKASVTGAFEEQIAESLLSELRKRDCHEVAIDTSADGGIHAQAIAAAATSAGYKLKVLLVSFQGTADADAEYEVGGQRKKAKDLFDRRVSELWYSYRISVQNGVIRGLRHGTRAVKQLGERRVEMDEKRRWSVEKKKEMKKRLKRSPDDGDAVVLVGFLATKKGLAGAGKASLRPTPTPTWPDMSGKPKAAPAHYTAAWSGNKYGKR